MDDILLSFVSGPVWAVSIATISCLGLKAMAVVAGFSRFLWAAGENKTDKYDRSSHTWGRDKSNLQQPLMLRLENVVVATLLLFFMVVGASYFEDADDAILCKYIDRH